MAGNFHCDRYLQNIILFGSITIWVMEKYINLNTSEYSQLMISYRLASHTKPLAPIIREIEALFMTDKETPMVTILFFKIRPKIIPSKILWL